MEERGLSGVGEELDKMMNPNYWKELNISYDKNHKSRYLEMWGESKEIYLAYMTIYNRSLSLAPEYEKRVMRLLSTVNIPDKAMAEKFRGKVLDCVDTQKKYFEGKVHHDWSGFQNKIYKNWQIAAEVKKSKPVRADNVEYLKVIKSAANKRAINISAQASSRLVSEAQMEFDKILDALQKNKLDYVVRHLCDDGRPLIGKDENTTESIKQILENKDLMAGLKSQAALFGEVKRLYKKKSTATISCYGFMKNSGVLTASAANYPEAASDFIMLQLPSPELGVLIAGNEKYFNNSVTNIPVLDRSQVPLITMVYEARTWYWNPLGW